MTVVEHDPPTDGSISAPTASKNTQKQDEADDIILSDAELVEQAEHHIEKLRHLEAAECLKKVADKSLLNAKLRHILEIGEAAARVKDELMKPHREEWKKQSETHGHRDTVVYYKVASDNAIVCRVETPIESSLLIPLISVLNESDLFHTWMPSYKVPKLGISKSEILKFIDIGNQIVDVCIDMPFPFQNRQCIQHAVAIDCIESDNCILVSINSVDTGKHFEIEIPPVAKNYKRVDLNAGILIRSCPPNHPSLKKSKHKYPQGEKLLLISLRQQIDAHVSGVPLPLINFFTRTVLGQQWGALLQVAEDVKLGKRPAHKKAIEQKAELYGWVEQRVQVMFDNLEKQPRDQKSKDDV